MKGIFKDDRKGESLTPVLVLLGIIAFAGAGFFVAGQFLLKTETYPNDNGVNLDEEIVDYGTPYLYIEVSGRGTIKIELNEKKAPITVANFKTLADKGFYDGLTFHRCIPDFMIQGGDPSGDGSGGPGYTIEPETDNGLGHDRGVIAMAKRGDETRMSGSQFYIVQAESGAHHLDGQHTVFGKVIEGMNIVDAIANTQTDANDKPLNPVTMERVYISYE